VLFTIIDKLHQTIDISLGPPPNTSSPSPPASITNPPQYSATACSIPRVLTNKKAVAKSSEVQPTKTHTLVFKVFPSQPQRDDLVNSEIDLEPDLDDEALIAIGQKELICLSISHVSQCHYSQTTGRVEGSECKEGMFANACIDLPSQF